MGIKDFAAVCLLMCFFSCSSDFNHRTDKALIIKGIIDSVHVNYDKDSGDVLKNHYPAIIFFYTHLVNNSEDTILLMLNSNRINKFSTSIFWERVNLEKNADSLKYRLFTSASVSVKVLPHDTCYPYFQTSVDEVRERYDSLKHKHYIDYLKSIIDLPYKISYYDSTSSESRVVEFYKSKSFSISYHKKGEPVMGVK